MACQLHLPPIHLRWNCNRSDLFVSVNNNSSGFTQEQASYHWAWNKSLYWLPLQVCFTNYEAPIMQTSIPSRKSKSFLAYLVLSNILNPWWCWLPSWRRRSISSEHCNKINSSSGNLNREMFKEYLNIFTHPCNNSHCHRPFVTTCDNGNYKISNTARLISYYVGRSRSKVS